MRYLTLGTLTTLLLILGIVPAIPLKTIASEQAQGDVDTQPNVRPDDPFDLVAAAYRGEFEAQGVPGYNQLEQAYETGEIDAEILVKKAIKAGALPPAAANDEGYINAVKLQLDQLNQERGN